MVKFRKYVVDIFDGMAKGLFSSLLIGLILKQIGELANSNLLIDLGQIAQIMMGPAIGAGITHSLKANQFTFVSGIVLGAIGAGTVFVEGGQVMATIGEPVGALIVSLIGILIGNFIEGNTKLDIILVPLGAIVGGGLVSYFVTEQIVMVTQLIGEFINRATLMRPIPMGIILSVVMGMLLTLPLSSAAIGISLGLNGIAAGAAAVGCACNMIGFAVGSFRENGISGLISQGLGTSMLQMSNIIKKPVVWLPSIITSAILGPIATTIVPISATPSGSGMGTSGLVGIFSALEAMGRGSGQVISILFMFIIAPAMLALVITQYFRNKGWIKYGDLKLQ